PHDTASARDPRRGRGSRGRARSRPGPRGSARRRRRRERGARALHGRGPLPARPPVARAPPRGRSLDLAVRAQRPRSGNLAGGRPRLGRMVEPDVLPRRGPRGPRTLVALPVSGVVAVFAAPRADTPEATEFLRVLAALRAVGRTVSLVEAGRGAGV